VGRLTREMAAVFACGILAFSGATVLASTESEASGSAETAPDAKRGSGPAPSTDPGVDPAPDPEEMSPAPTDGGEPGSTSLKEVLAGVSGVRVATMCTNCNIAGVTISGQSDERVQVWQDGLPVMGGLGAIYLLSVMPPQGIASTAVVRGAGTVLSGSEASAGALEINTSRPKDDPTLHAAVDFGSLNWRRQELFTSGRLGRWGGSLVLTHARSDGSDADGDGNYDIGAFDRDTFGGTVTIDASESSQIRLDALYYDEEQRDSKGAYDGSADVELGNFLSEDIDIRRREYALGWDYRFRDGSVLSLGGRFSKRDQETSDDSDAEQPYMLVDETTEAVELRYERFLDQRHLLTVGLVHRLLEVDGDIRKVTVAFPEGQHLDDFIRHRGVYAQGDLALPHRLNLTAGLRWDEYDWTPGPGSTLRFPIPGPTVESRFSPRLRLAWRATPKLSLGVSAGYGFAAPRPVFERVCCGAVVISSAYSEPEESKNYLVEADYVPYPWVRFRGSVFRNDFENFLQKMAIGTAPEFIPTFTQVNYTDFSLEGATFATEFRHLERLSYGFEYTHLRTRSDEPIWVKRYRAEWYEMSVDQIPFHPSDQGSVFLGWNDNKAGFSASAQALYTGSMYIQELYRNSGSIKDSWAETPSFWVYNVDVRKRVYRYVWLFAGVDNITDEVQLWLDDPRYEYNWGPLRGRYVYGGISFDL
jgi:outer membrane receptor for ferrienterochelin and colicin